MEVRFIAIIVYAILSSRPLGAVASVSTITSVPVRYLHQFYSGVSHLARLNSCFGHCFNHQGNDIQQPS